MYIKIFVFDNISGKRIQMTDDAAISFKLIVRWH